MKFTSLTAKYPGTCKRCKQPISVGDRIRYGGPGITYHMAENCQQASSPASVPAQATADDHQRIGRTVLQAMIDPDFEQTINRAALAAALDTPIAEPQPAARFTFETMQGTTWTQPAAQPTPTRQPVTATAIDSDLF